MNAYKETKDILKKYNITANKKLGQNFLIDDEVIENIIKASGVSKDDLIIEIGPGLRNTYKRSSRKCRKGHKCRIRCKND